LEVALMWQWYRWVLILIFLPSMARPAELTLGPRVELTHPGQAHEVHLSGAAVAVARDGGVFLTWAAEEGQTINLYLVRVGAGDGGRVRVNPDGMTVDSLHQPPGIDIGPGGEIYLSWSSSKPKPEGTLFASDLRLSRSLDGGRNFDTHLRVNEDRPISHGFEGLAAAEDGTVILSWIDSRDGRDKAATYVARIGGWGTRVEQTRKLDEDTCVCCRIDVATGPKNTMAVAWRKVFPDNIRDMVLAVSRDGARSFAAPTLVHADGWQIAACPHRGGAVDMDESSRIYLAWYTEGPQDQPRLLFAVSPDGRRFTEPKRLDSSTTSIPDHVRLAVDAGGRALIVWEDSTAVRRRVLLRYTADGGETLGPIQVLSQAIKAYAPSIAISPRGEFVVVWHEEQFPITKTVIQPIRLDDAR
jgi:hypothetical protein